MDFNAVLGNTGGTNVDQGNVAWNPGFSLGSYGRDTTTGSAWAVLNHNSEFGIIPEPTTWALLAFSLTIVMVLRRRRSKLRLVAADTNSLAMAVRNTQIAFAPQ